MVSKVSMVLAGCAALLPGVALAQSPPPSVDALIARHIAARGGYAALKAIHTLEMTGTLRPAGFDADLQYKELIARPDSVRIEATLQGMTPIQAFDGQSGWQIQPFQGRRDPETLSSDDDKSLVEEADFEDALVDYKAKGETVDYLGEVDVDGGPTYAVRATLKNGDQQTFYIDPDAWLTVRMVTRQKLRGAETLTETDYGDYEKVNGVYFPFEVDSGPKGSAQLQRVTYKTISANVALDPAIFREPKGPAVGVQQATTPARPEDKKALPPNAPDTSGKAVKPPVAKR
ncbi:MAG: hypothetical protein ACREEB_00415 [Caulobacteraceae bacterium]